MSLPRRLGGPDIPKDPSTQYLGPLKGRGRGI